MPTRDPFEGTKYRLVRSLGIGAAAEVFLVEHKDLGSRYVAKVLHPWLVQDKAGRRFSREARALAQLQDHPNIVRVLGFDTAIDGRPFIVLEHLEGETLTHAMAAQGGPSIAFALVVTWEILLALGAAHQRGIVHRDIKPDNLLIARRANGTTVLKVLDFGIARLARDAQPGAPIAGSDPLTTDSMLGTARFTSPEAVLGAPVDERADLYATALVLYLMLTGRDLFGHLADTSLLLMAHAVEDPEPPSRYSCEPIPPELDEVVLHALEKDPDARFQTAEEFLEALRPFTFPFLRAETGSSELVRWSPEPANEQEPALKAGAPASAVSNEDLDELAYSDLGLAEPEPEPEPEPELKLEPEERSELGCSPPVESWVFRLLVAATFVLAAAVPAVAVFTLVALLARLP